MVILPAPAELAPWHVKTEGTYFLPPPEFSRGHSTVLSRLFKWVFDGPVMTVSLLKRVFGVGEKTVSPLISLSPLPKLVRPNVVGVGGEVQP